MNPNGRPRRSLDDKRIIERYLAGESESALASYYAVGRTSIHRRLVTAGVALRTAVEASDGLCHKRFFETSAVLELLDGLLLGDAYLGDHQNSEARLELSQRRDRLEWLCAVETAFIEHGLLTTIKDRGSRGWQLRTKKYANLTEQRKRWYPNGLKRVPLDIRLTPIVLAHWYWGDGSTENNGYRMSFCTDGFPKGDVEFLIKCLQSAYNWHPRLARHQGKYRISVTLAHDRQELTSLLRPLCPSCFEYKLCTKR